MLGGRPLRLGLGAIFLCCLIGISSASAVRGPLDRTFSRDGIKTVRIPHGGGFAEDAAVQNDGRIVVVGGGGHGQFAVVSLTASGSLDRSFAGDGVWTRSFQREALDDGGPSSVLAQPDGKLVVAGYLTRTSTDTYEQSSHLILLRLLPDGGLDPTFDRDGRLDLEIEATAAFNERVGLALQGDGKLVAGLTQGSRHASLEALVARFNPDGSLDPSFAGDGRAEVGFGSMTSDVAALALQPDGRIVVAGTVSRRRRSSIGLLRLTTSGEPDPTFSRNGWIATRVGGPNARGNDVALTDDGGAVVVGGSIHYGKEPGDQWSELAVARFDADGRLYHGFSGDGKRTLRLAPNSAASAVAAQADGKFVVTGAAGSQNSRTEAVPVLRFTPRGRLDGTFARRGLAETAVGRPGGLGPIGRGITIQPDKKIVVVGNATFDRRRLEFAVLRYRGD